MLLIQCYLSVSNNFQFSFIVEDLVRGLTLFLETWLVNPADIQAGNIQSFTRYIHSFIHSSVVDMAGQPSRYTDWEYTVIH